jgi:hypothetical protein
MGRRGSGAEFGANLGAGHGSAWQVRLGNDPAPVS